MQTSAVPSQGRADGQGTWPRADILKKAEGNPDRRTYNSVDGKDIPAVINSPGCRQGHGLCKGLKAQAEQVLICWRPPDTESAACRPGNSYWAGLRPTTSRRLDG